MSPKQFQRLVERDKHCLHCGETEAVSPNHRANRGMGGSKQRDVPSNLVLLCSWMNGMIESDTTCAQLAREKGWKLNSWDDPKQVPVWDMVSGVAFLLDDNFARTVIV